MTPKSYTKLFGSIAMLLLPMAGIASGLNKVTNENELEYFIQTYYMHPQPQLVPFAIEYLGSSKLLSKYKNAALPTAAFFSKLFSDNPSSISDWKKVIDKQDTETRAMLIQAVHRRIHCEFISS
ncbi:MAG: hypothetical protein ACYCZQ_08465 [Burkholderiales bacterium]